MTVKGIGYIACLILSTAVCIAASAQQPQIEVVGSADEMRLSLSCKGADIRDVLRGIAMQYGVNIIPDSNVTGSVTIHLQDTPFAAGLAILLETNGFEYENRNGMYLVHAKVSKEKTYEVSFQNGRLSLDARNADIKQLLREITTKAGINIVYEGDLTGTITAHLMDMPPADALYNILTTNGFIVDDKDGIYSVRAGRMQQQQRGGGNFSVSYRNSKLSIDARNVPAGDLLYEIATQCKINLINIGNMQGNVTIRLDSVSLEQAMDAISNAASISYRLVDDVYIAGEAIVRPGQTNPLLEQKVIWLKHIEAQDLVNSLPTDIPRTSVTVSQDRNALIVLGPKELIQRIENLIEEIDIENPGIRSRQQMAMSVEVDDQGLLTIDAKDAPMEMLLREISIKRDVDMTMLDGYGTGGQALSRASIRRPQESQLPQQPQAQGTTTTSTARIRSASLQTGGGFGGLVNLRISKASLEDTLDALFKGTGYAYKRVEGDDNVGGDRDFYIIGTGDLNTGISNPLVVSRKIPLKYLNALDVVDALPLNIPDSNIIVIGDQNALVIMGTQTLVDEVESYLGKIDSPAPQIMIEAFLVEVTRGDSRDLGISWSWADDKKRNMVTVTPGLSVAFDSLAGVPENFFASLNALVSENRARVLAKPRIATTNGLKATINVGWTDYFETATEIYTGGSTTEPSSGAYYPSYGGYTRRGFNTLESGITMDITPWVGAAGEITVLIHPDIKDAKQISREHSTIATRSLDTTVRVKDGETIVIGGLIQRNQTDQETRVPVLGKIPVLGHLFKKSQKTHTDTELIVIVKPKIISNGVIQESKQEN